jgi:hypothetical protein
MAASVACSRGIVEPVTAPSAAVEVSVSEHKTSSGRSLYFVGRPSNAPSDVLSMNTGRSFCIRAGVLLAAVSIAVTAACSGDSTPHMTTATTVPVPAVSAPFNFLSQKVDPAQWQKSWRSTPGSAARSCVQVKNLTDVRSNSFIVGNFRSYRDQWDGTIENSKLYYVPLYPEPTKPPLAISVEPLDGQPADTLVVQGGNDYAWSLAGFPFYATGTLLPHRGRWRLVATAGRNWGCFDLTL